ncbi:MAG TPA: phosphodiester glycosidase family protein [Acidimicrobiales bacterium]|nr:phosphodiester glycosidase family protein [Acidimicrobiales bacterium]
MEGDGATVGLGRAGALRATLRHWRRLVLAAVLLFVAVTGWSYAHALTGPGTDSLGARSVEWVRNHGGSGLVQYVEREWYGHHPPAAGGAPARNHLPNRVTGGAYTAGDGLARPADVAPLVTASSVAGEGRWTPVGRPVAGSPPAYVTFVRPDPSHTSVVASLAWMDTTLLRAELFAGYDVPGGRGWTPRAPITPADGDLVAAFNSGFRLQDAVESGYYSRGRTAAPLVTGYASLVVFADGRVTVGKWGRDVQYSPDIVSIRQNLPLIVDGGQPVPGLQDDRFQRWGATLGNKLYVWRSGVGVTADGALVYAAGDKLSIRTLAVALARAGAVRAMELDINTDWVDYFYFNPPPGSPAAPANAVKLIPAMVSSTQKYFQPSSKDFIAMFADPAGAGARKQARSAPIPAGG